MLWVSGWYMSWLISYHQVRSFCRVGLGFHQPLLHSEWWNCPVQFRKRTPPRQSSSHHSISALLFSSLVSHCSTPKQRSRYIKPHARSSPWNFPKASSGRFTRDIWSSLGTLCKESAPSMNTAWPQINSVIGIRFPWTKRVTLLFIRYVHLPVTHLSHRIEMWGSRQFT